MPSSMYYTLSLHDALPILLAAVCPPTKLTTVALCVPVTSPANEPLKLVALVALVAVVALPITFAVIVPAEKLPDASRFTMVLRSEEHTSELQSLTNLVCRLPCTTLFPYTTLFRSC